MFRNYLISALRNLARNKLQSAIAIGGLAIGLSAVILIGLAIRNQLTFEHFLSGHERTYLVMTAAALPNRPTDYFVFTPHDVPARMRQSFSEIEDITRIDPDDRASLRHGNTEAREIVNWADPNVFSVLSFPVLSGDLKTALEQPDSIVVPLSVARKYFGRDDPIGETIELNREHPLKVTAVIADLPVNGTTFRSAIFVSGRAQFSTLAQAEKEPPNGPGGRFIMNDSAYLKLKPGASIAALQKAVSARADDLLPHPDTIKATLLLTRVDEVHLTPTMSPGLTERIAVMAALAILILFVACVNFVNLATARSMQRAKEVGIRKAAGADRSALIYQFLGESLITMLLALCVAVALTEVALPYVNAFLNSGAVFDYWRDPLLIAIIVPAVFVVGILAGFYPALVLSTFRPAAVLKGILQPTAGSALRQVLATTQFAILIVLTVAAGTVYQQRHYATTGALRVDTDQVLVVRGRCYPAFVDQIRALPGVRAAACSSWGPIADAWSEFVDVPGGGSSWINAAPVNFRVLELYGFKPIAGRFFSEEFGSDEAPEKAPPEFVKHAVINEEAVKLLGFKSPQAAIGQMMRFTKPLSNPPELLDTAQIIGVVEDYSPPVSMTNGPPRSNTVEQKVKPTWYFISKDFSRGSQNITSIKLAGRNIPETLAAIDKLWDTTGATAPIDRVFLDAYIEDLYLSMLREAQAFAIFSFIAMFLACLGLFGLSVFTAQRRVKEIGVRKAMGADTRDIMRLLLWQFAKPVLWASLIAWPLGYYLMNRWLNGFAYHVALDIRLFIGATLLALLIALLTVAGQAFVAARAKPAMALAYE